MLVCVVAKERPGACPALICCTSHTLYTCESRSPVPARSAQKHGTTLTASRMAISSRSGETINGRPTTPMELSLALGSAVPKIVVIDVGATRGGLAEDYRLAGDLEALTATHV